MGFLSNDLTDPRVANGEFPFDGPALRSELPEGPELRLGRDVLGRCGLQLLPPEGQLEDGHRGFRGSFPETPGGGPATPCSRGSAPRAAHVTPSATAASCRKSAS
jgi:hypothetical protein